MTGPTLSQVRRRSGRHALLTGLAVSALIHLLILLLNPTMTPDPPGSAGIARAPVAPRGQLLDFVVRAVPRQTTSAAPAPVTQGALAPVATTVAPADSGGGVTATVSATATGQTSAGSGTVDRRSSLRYGAAPIWAPPAPRIETCAQRVRREFAERMTAAIADKNVGKVPPSAGAPARSPGIGIRIPFGRKPPGPAVVVPPPPPPDSFRSALKPQRDTVNLRLFAADSLRCAAQDRLEVPARPDTLTM